VTGWEIWDSPIRLVRLSSNRYDGGWELRLCRWLSLAAMLATGFLQVPDGLAVEHALIRRRESNCGRLHRVARSSQSLLCRSLFLAEFIRPYQLYPGTVDSAWPGWPANIGSGPPGALSGRARPFEHTYMPLCGLQPRFWRRSPVSRRRALFTVLWTGPLPRTGHAVP